MFKLILIATLALLAASTSTQLESIFDKHSSATMVSSIQSLIQMSEPIGRLQEIADLLEEINLLLITQQDEADKANDRRITECEGQSAYFEKEIEGGNKVIDDYKDERQTLILEQTSKSGEVETLTQENKEAQDTADQLGKELTEENEKFEQFIANFQKAIDTTNIVKTHLNTVSANPTVFIQNKFSTPTVMLTQMSTNLSEVKANLEKTSNEGKEAALLMTPMMDVLTQLQAGQLDLAKVDQIFELLDTLLARLNEGVSARRLSNESLNESLGSQIAAQEKIIQSNVTQIGVLEIRLAEIATLIQNKDKLISEQEQVVSALVQEYEDLKEACKADAERYANETTIRKANLAVLEELIKHFEGNVAPSVEKIGENAAKKEEAAAKEETAPKEEATQP